METGCKYETVSEPHTEYRGSASPIHVKHGVEIFFQGPTICVTQDTGSD